MTIPETITSVELMSLTGYTRQYLVDLEAQGIAKKRERGKWLTVETIRGIITHLRDTNRRGHAGPRQALEEVKAREIWQKIANKNRLLMPRADVEAMLDKLCRMVCIELGGLPSRFARDLAVRAALEKEVNGSLERIAKALAKCKEAERTGNEE